MSGPGEWSEDAWDDLLSQPGDSGQTLAEVRRQVGLPALARNRRGAGTCRTWAGWLRGWD